MLDGPRQRLDGWAERLPNALTRSVQLRRVRLYESTGALRPGLLRRAWESDRRRLDTAIARLSTGAIERDIERKSRDLTALSRRLSDAGTRQVQRWRERVDGLERLRETVGYEATLRRGYAVVRGDGDVVTTKAAAETASGLEIEFADGKLAVVSGGGSAPKKAKPKPDAPDQGSLF